LLGGSGLQTETKQTGKIESSKQKPALSEAEGAVGRRKGEK
jgi:hypothetical protein